MIRSATLQDADQIREIYNYYIFNTTVSFEKTPVSLEEMTKRMSAILPLYPWLVYVGEREILGYAYATKWKPRYSSGTKRKLGPTEISSKCIGR